jgi:hypothetical protein
MKEQKKETAAETINSSQILPKNFKELWHKSLCSKKL